MQRPRILSIPLLGACLTAVLLTSCGTPSQWEQQYTTRADVCRSQATGSIGSDAAYHHCMGTEPARHR